MRNTNNTNTTKTSKVEFFIQSSRNGWAVLESDGRILFDGFDSEAAAANMVVRFCQDHELKYAIYYRPTFTNFLVGPQISLAFIAK